MWIPQDRFNTFNMGIGWVAIVRPEDAEAALKAGPGGTVIGTLREGRGHSCQSTGLNKNTISLQRIRHTYRTIFSSSSHERFS